MTGREITVAELYDDELSDAYHVGQIDARNRRPRRIDLADTTPLAVAYHHGYDTKAPCPTCHGAGMIFHGPGFDGFHGVPCPDCQEAGR